MKGAIAKEKVTETIAKAFGKNFVGIIDKKIYVTAEEDGEMVQVCLTLTCPKTPVTPNGEDGIDFNKPTASPDKFIPAEITNEETEKIRELIKQFGL